MAKTQLSKSKSICVLAVVVCCFAILWPKIFLPMLQSALSLSSVQNDNQRSDVTMLPPKVREAMRLSRPEQLKKLPTRAFQRDNQMNTNEIPRTGGLMTLVMPLYTIGIVVFFLYTILRMVFNNKSDKEEEEVNQLQEEEETTKPIIKDYKMDPEYRKFILNDEYDENGKRVKGYQNHKRKTKQNSNSAKNMQKSEQVLQSFGKDRVSKALHVLIRDMEEFKSKLLEVEQTKRQTEVDHDHSQQNTSNVCQNDTQKEENENSVEKQINEKDNKDNSFVQNIQSEDEKENHKQMEKELSIDSENETNDENAMKAEFDSNKDEYEHKERLIENLESYYWESLLKGMKELKQHAKEE